MLNKDEPMIGGPKRPKLPPAEDETGIDEAPMDASGEGKAAAVAKLAKALGVTVVDKDAAIAALNDFIACGPSESDADDAESDTY
jgi:hypothetical protein